MKLMSISILIILSTMLVGSIQIDTKAEATTIVVPDDYLTINDAISNSSEGDTIFVKNGIYNENLKIYKSISLVGQDAKNTIIEGNHAHPVIVVRHDNVTVSSFTLKNGASKSTVTIYYKALVGVHLLHANNCKITGNIIKNSGIGVWIYDARNNLIEHNIYSNNIYGLIAESSDSNIIHDNYISNNGGGIRLLSARNNRLSNNSMIDNNHSFLVSGNELSYFINDVENSNTVETKPMCYWVNVSSKTVPSNAGCVVLINCTDITVKDTVLLHQYNGITFAYTHNSTVTNNTITNSGTGIKFQASSGNTIQNNKITGANGIISDGNGTIITNNTITEEKDNYNKIGISVTGSYQSITQNIINRRSGDAISCNGYYNNVTSNILTETEGVSIQGCFNNVYGNTITGGGLSVSSDNNIIAKNNVSGYILVTSSLNLIRDNNVSRQIRLNGNNNTLYGNSLQGVVMGNRVTDASNNLFYRNSFHFSYNDEGHRLFTIWEGVEGTEFIDNGVEGNYWSDYNGTDDNGDGIGDTPYKIYAKDSINYYNIAEFNIADLMLIDNYPLMAPIRTFDAGKWEWNDYAVYVISNSTVSNFSFNSKNNSINFSLDCENGTAGFCRVIIPKELLNVENSNWIVFCDNKILENITITESSDNSYLYLNFNNKTKNVEIIGTTAIPEFPSGFVVLLIFGCIVSFILTKNVRRRVS